MPNGYASLQALRRDRPLGVAYLRPYETVTEYGRPEYGRALTDWQRMYGSYAGMMGGVTPAMQEMMGYYRPGGGYGAGRREEAAETVRGGVSREMGGMVAAGMSSQFGARGTQARAGAELSRLYKNIEDTRAQLQMQAIQPYAQMMQAMTQVQQARPTYGQYVQPVTTTGQRWF